MKLLIPLAALLAPLLAGCVPAPSDAPAMPVGSTRPMDEVPEQRRLSNGDREYRFANGCRIVLDGVRAVVRTEGPVCALYQRDIALLYASGD